MQQRNVSHSIVGILASGYAMSGSDIRVSSLKCTASHCQLSKRTLLILLHTSNNFRAQIKKIISGQTITVRQ